MRQVLVEVGVERREIAERRLVERLENLELELVVGVDPGERGGERFDERHGRKRIRFRFEAGPVEQIGNAAIECNELVVGGVLDHANDVAGDHRLVHRLMVDQRQLADVELGKIGLRALGMKTLFDTSAQALVEFDEQIRALTCKHGARFAVELAFLG